MATPKKAPPLGKLITSDTAKPQLPRELLKQAPAASPVERGGGFRTAPAAPVTKAPAPVAKVPVPTPTPQPAQDVGAPLPTMFNVGDSIPAHSASQTMIDQIIAGNTDPTAAPVVTPSGSGGREGITQAFGDDGPEKQLINNNPDTPGAARIPDGVPLQSLAAPVLNYATGPTQTMLDQQFRTNEIQAIAPTLAPSVQPAMQWNPQALDPSVTGGIVPKAEDQNPLGWLYGDNKTGDLNPLKGNFAGGTGIMGAVSFMFGRVGNTAMGIGADVARGIAAVGDGFNNAGLSLSDFGNGLFNTAAGMGANVAGARNAGETFNKFTQGASQSFNANSPAMRGSPIKTIGGNKQAADIANSSYTLAGLVGTNDFSFSGVGNRGAGRDVIVKGQFNPYGFQNPFGEFKTDYRDKKTNKQVYLTPDGTKFGLSNTWLMYTGLVADVVLGGKIDQVGTKFLPKGLKFLGSGAEKATKKSATAVVKDVTLPQGPRNAPNASFNPRVDLRGPVLTRPTGNGLYNQGLPVNPKADYSDPWASVPQAKTSSGEVIPYRPTKHSQGGAVPANRSILKANPVSSGNKSLVALPGDVARKLPATVNPFAAPTINPKPLVIDFSGGGAVIVRDPGTGALSRTPLITSGSSDIVNKAGAVVPEKLTDYGAVQRDGIIRNKTIKGDKVTPDAPVKPDAVNPEKLVDYGAVQRDGVIRNKTVKGDKVTPDNVAPDTLVAPNNIGMDGTPVVRDTLVKPDDVDFDNAALSGQKVVPDELVARRSSVVFGNSGDVPVITRSVPDVRKPPTPVTVLEPRVVAEIVDVTPVNLPNVRVVAQAVPDVLPEAMRASPTAPGVFAQADDVARADAARLQRIAAREQSAANVPAKVPSSPVEVPPVGAAPIPTPRGERRLVARGKVDIEQPLVNNQPGNELYRTEPLRLPVPQEVAPDTFITAEALSPTLNSRDIVQQLTSTDAIPGATYNPRLVLRQERSLQSVVQLARSIELPGGVRILGDELSDATVSNFSRLAKKVDSAIIAAGLNPSDAEVGALRRMFQKNGAPLPTNLEPGFSIRVAGRRTDTPASFVKPVVHEPVGYTPKYPLSDDYGLAVKVKQDKAGNLVPATQADDVVKVTQQPAVVGERVIKSFTPDERAAIVAKAVADGDTAPASIQRAADDVINPAVGEGDDVATKAYATDNLPKDIVPAKSTPETDELLATRHEAHQELEHVNAQLDDLTMQLTDIETNLDKALAHIDTLPDIGKVPTDITIPTVPYTPVPKDVSKQVVQSIDDTIDKSRAVTNADILQRAEDARAATKADKKTGLYKSYTPDQANLPAGTKVADAIKAGIVGRTHNEILDRYALTFKSGAKGRPIPVRTANGVVLNGDAYTSGAKGNISKVVASAPVQLPDELFHGTRNSTLDLAAANPMQGAARSEYGTALWLTGDEDIAMSAASRAVPENVPGGVGGRELGGESFIHNVDSASLGGLNIVSHTVPLPRATLHDVADSLRDSIDEPWVANLADKLEDYISSNKTVTPAQLFSKVDEFTAESTEALFRQRPTEEELTLVQRITTDILKGAGIDGVSNGKGVALYGADNIRTSTIHTVTDMVADDPASHILQEVNLLARMSEAEPDSSLLKVQLAEARARAANYIKQDVEDEMEELTQAQIRHMDRMLDADDRLKGIAIRGKAEASDAARAQDAEVYRKFKKELDQDYTNGCL